MLTQRVTVPAFQPPTRLATPLTTWKHLAILVERHNIPGVGVVVAPSANLTFMRDVYVPYFVRQVDEYSRGRCAIDQTIVVPTTTLNVAGDIGGGNYWVSPDNLHTSGIWAEVGGNAYDSISVYTDQTGCPTPAYAGNTVGFWDYGTGVIDPGVSHLDQNAPSVGAAFAAADSVQVHEWIHQLESWFSSAQGGSFTMPDVHTGGSRIDPRTGALYTGANGWWEFYQDVLTGKLSSGANLPGITDAIWASGRPNT